MEEKFVVVAARQELFKMFILVLHVIYMVMLVIFVDKLLFAIVSIRIFSLIFNICLTVDISVDRALIVGK